LNFRCFKAAPVQELSEDDKRRRVVFANEIIRMIDEKPNLMQRIIWTDEAMFTLNGMINRRNFVYKAPANPFLRLSLPHKSVGVHVWIEFHSEGVIGPFIFDTNVTGASYLKMLETFAVPQVMQIADHNQFYWQQDGAPPHWAINVRNFLNATFGERWIGRSGPIQRPPRSPDLTPCDFDLWGHLNALVYKNRPESLDALRMKIRNCCRELPLQGIRNSCASVEIVHCKRRISNLQFTWAK